jgi:hypothetical protein
MIEQDPIIRGSCLCRTVAYAVAGRPGPMWHCHCVSCRKLSGAAFATHMAALAADFTWLCGQASIAHYALSSTPTRSFCGQCGAVVPYAACDGRRVILPAGGLADAPGVRPCAHVWVAAQAPWHTITDALPRFARSSPDLPACPPQSGAPPTHIGEAGYGRGSCLCGRVVYEVHGTLDVIKNCHCWRDRKMTGAPHASCLPAAASVVRWLRGEALRVVYSLPEAPGFRTGFCRVCGTSLPALVPHVESLCIPAGGLDNDPGARVQYHIFCGEQEKAPWFEVTDELPQFARYAPPGVDWRHPRALGHGT